MATTTKAKNTKSKTSSVNKTVEKVQPKVEAEVATSPIKAKEVDEHQYITVKNGFHGLLFYKSNKTGESFYWDSYGAEQDMELCELKSARNSSKDFFINNWFMFDDEWVIDYLGMRQYYKHGIDINNYDDIFSKNSSEIKEIISDMTESQRRSVIYRATELIESGVIDSRKTISTLEEALGVELTER